MKITVALVATLTGVAAFAPSAKPGASTALSSKSLRRQVTDMVCRDVAEA